MLKIVDLVAFSLEIKKCVTHTIRATQKNTARFVATQNLSLALQRIGIEPVFLPEIKTHAKLKDKLNFV